jgi:hypothetical protein
MTHFLTADPVSLVVPVALVDLDDTLFQTHRRMLPQPDFQAVTVDQYGQPLAYMNPMQQQFVQWLWHSTQVIPVTARSVEALSRVQLKFQSGAVCSHGGVLLNPDHSINQTWHQHMQLALASYQNRLQCLCDALLQVAEAIASIRTWVVVEQGLGLYVVAKQNHSAECPDGLATILNAMPSDVLQGFYFHLNGNNLALIPDPVSKANAVRFLLKTQNLTQRPIIGFGDSLSDMEFLNQCHWWGMPQQSQLNRWAQRNLQAQYTKEGYYGDYPC